VGEGKPVRAQGIGGNINKVSFLTINVSELDRAVELCHRRRTTWA
jgi:hypothetical protein